MIAKSDPFWRRLGAGAYRLAVNARLQALAAPLNRKTPCLWYAGARAGTFGGPALKLAKLQAVFPETEQGFNLVYTLSAAPHLSLSSFARLRKARIPALLNQNGVFYPAWFAGDWQARNRRMAVAHERADHVLYQSAFCRLAAQEFLGPRETGYEILFNAVDTELFSPPQGDSTSSFTFLVTGKIDRHQAYRVTQALEALVIARRRGLPAKLILAGRLDAEVQRQAEAIIARHDLGACVRLSGPYTQAEAPALYRSAQAYLTLTHQDACPSGVIEALASGLPVVHPLSGGVPELVGEAGVGLETGLDWNHPLIPSAVAVADAMLRLAENRETLSRSARERAVRQFGFEAWIGRHRSLFLDLLARA
ncbi:MAG: glycosyltransferase family 4 protein [Alphaproteobacteria bacterium]|nr:glycosyltransferase family 4 protein [Alphaproteobacteria bacterium]